MATKTASTEAVKPDFDIKHSCYAEEQAIRQIAADLFAGSATVKGKGKTYLYQTPNESEESYGVRLNRAVYENWPGCVVEARQSMLWSKAPNRQDFSEEYAKWLADVDGHGTDADTFFKGIMERASVEGLHFVLVDKTQPEEAAMLALKQTQVSAGADANAATVVSKADEASLGIRPVMVSLAADCVYDWHIGRDCKLVWAVVASERVESAGPGFAPIVTAIRTVWTRNDWTAYRAEEENQSGGIRKTVWKEDSNGTNPTGAVPLVAFYGFKIAEMIGRSVVKDILGHTISVYNKFSDRDIFELMTNNPIPYLIGESNPQKVVVGGGNALFLSSAGGKQCEVGYLEPSGMGANSSRTSEQDLIRRIFEIALRQARRDTAQVQSGDALKEEKEIFTASLSSIAVTTENGERRCWALFNSWDTLTPVHAEGANGDSTGAGVGTVEYNKEFRNDDIDSAMLDSYSGLVLKNQLSRKTLWERMKLAGLLPDDFDAEAEAVLIEEDSMSTGMPGFGTPPGLPAPATKPADAPPPDEGKPPASPPPDDTPPAKA